MSEKDVLAVWMDGFAQPAGLLVRTAKGETAFSYEDEYVEAGGLPLSVSLPTTVGAFGDIETRAFFANLLPENDQLQSVMEREQLARDDVVGLLHYLGADCAGAVSCVPVGAPPVKTPGDLSADYEPLEDREIVEIVRSLYQDRRLPRDVRDPSPVAGVQSKIALTLLAEGRFALPREGARVPTTHILKVPERGRTREPRLEEAAALLASAAGLDVSVPQVVKIGDVEALLVERFDRRVQNGVVTRIHQEDFAQALGFPSELKYQRKGRAPRWFDVQNILSVLDKTDDPISARVAFLRATVFNLCIGNTDNHAKNHALLYDKGQVPRFAPLYDLLPIRLSDRYTHELAFQIGKAKNFDEATAGDLAEFFAAFGVLAGRLDDFIAAEIVPILEALEKATPRLRSIGLRQFDDLIGREAEELVERLSLAVEIRPRDYFPHEGVA